MEPILSEKQENLVRKHCLNCFCNGRFIYCMANEFVDDDGEECWPECRRYYANCEVKDMLEEKYGKR